MEIAMKRFNDWLQQTENDLDTHAELRLLQREGCAEEFRERFGTEISFGTGGLRGVMGAGCSRINLYTIGKATQGLANWLQAQHYDGPVAIAHDNRLNSREFALRAAQVLAANGIQAMLYPRFVPTPALSFAVRHHHCAAGICITASHNPAQYNGYKVYGPEGGQLTDNAVSELFAAIQKVDAFHDVRVAGEKDTHISSIPEATLNAFLDAVLKQRVQQEEEPLQVVYTPLHGAGKECVLRALQMGGIMDEEILLVPQQAEADGTFPTCFSPNPEEKEALFLGMELCQSSEADILLGTDPDCDRVGVAVRHKGEMVSLSGNEVGVLLLDYLCQAHKKAGMLKKGATAVKTIVTTDLAWQVANRYHVQQLDVLTGFKYIGEQIERLENQQDKGFFMFGFEESCGYLSGNYVRDKDGVLACLLICDLARHHKANGRTLVDAINKIYQRYGYYCNELYNFKAEGTDDTKTFLSRLEVLRQNPLQEIAGMRVVAMVDYLTGLTLNGLKLPPSNMLQFTLADNSMIFVRPSGTEPKMKIYVQVISKTKNLACQKSLLIKDFFVDFFSYN